MKKDHTVERERERDQKNQKSIDDQRNEAKSKSKTPEHM